MNYSICITYYYKRNNIISLLRELNKYKKKKLEIIIRNDNPNHILKLDKKYCKRHKVKIYNEKEESLGELKSIKFLIDKASNGIISIIADDDLLFIKVFDYLDKEDQIFDVGIFPITNTKLNINKKDHYYIHSREDIISNFFKKKVNISGTIATFYKKKFLKKIIKDFKNKKYYFDTLLFLKSIFEGKFIFYNEVLGFNNVKSSRISSTSINLELDLHDNLLLLNYLKNKKHDYLYFQLIRFYLNNFYSVFFRVYDKKNIFYINRYTKNIYLKKKSLYNIRIFYLILKTKTIFYLKMFLIFLNS